MSVWAAVMVVGDGDGCKVGDSDDECMGGSDGDDEGSDGNI